jgi:hypothetical protein
VQVKRGGRKSYVERDAVMVVLVQETIFSDPRSNPEINRSVKGSAK